MRTLEQDLRKAASQYHEAKATASPARLHALREKVRKLEAASLGERYEAEAFVARRAGRS